MINRLGDAVYWIAIGVAVFVFFFTSSQSVFDGLLGVERYPYASESDQTRLLLSALLFAFYFAIGWAIRFLLSGRFDIGILPTKASAPGATFLDYLYGVLRRLVFLISWGSLRLAILLVACTIVYGTFAWGSPDFEFVGIPLLASGMLAVVYLLMRLGSYVLTGKGRIEV